MNTKLIAEHIFQKRMVTELYPTGIVSLVSDTFSFFDILQYSVPALKEDILARQPDEWGLCKTVFRPDSGDPADILCGIPVMDLTGETDYKGDPITLDQAEQWFLDEIRDKVGTETPFGEFGDPEPYGYFKFEGKTYKLTADIEWNRYDKQYYYIENASIASCEEVELTPQQKGAVECLWEVFGGTETDKGYKMLNDKVGLIYGDSITLERAKNIMERLEAKGFASGNVVFGIGSYTYQHVTRDTFGFAMKATYAEVNNEPRELFKDPATDSGTKKSAKGLLRVDLEDGRYKLSDQQTGEQEEGGELELVFKNGQLLKETSLQEIRDRLNSYL